MSVNTNLRYVILPGRNPSLPHLKDYQAAYRTWNEVWGEAYAELGVDRTLYSDEFTRQTEINCIFSGDTCVAMLFLTLVDFRSEVVAKDSYFKKWSPEDIKGLTRNGSLILVCSNTTVHKDWRRSTTGISTKDLIMHLVVRRFLNSQCHAMTGFVRKAKGIHELVYRFGAAPLRENVANFNDQDLVDIVAFYRGTTTLGPDPFIQDLGGRLWFNKTIVRSHETEIEDKSHQALAA